MNIAARLVICQSGLYAANGVLMTFIVVLLAAHGMTTGEVGLAMGLSTLTRVIAAPLWGYAADRLGRLRGVMAAGMLTGALPLIVMLLPQVEGFMPTLGLLLISSAGASAGFPLTDTMVWRSAMRHGFSFSNVRAAGSALFVAGVLGGGFAVGWLGSNSVAWLVVVGYLWTVISLPTVAPVPMVVAPRRAAAIRPLLANRDYRLVLASSALLQGAHAAYYGFSTLYWGRAGISNQIIGVLWAEGVVGEIVVMLLLRNRISRFDPWKLTMVAAGFATLRWVGSALTTDSWMLAVLQPLHAMSFTIPYLAALRIINERSPPHLAATAQTVYASLGVSAPTGLLMALVSVLYPIWAGNVFWLMAAFSVAGLVLVWLARRRVVPPGAA